MRTPLLVAVFGLCSLAARADTLTYAVNASFSGGATIKGTVSLDNASGLFTAANFTNAGFPVSNGNYTNLYHQNPFSYISYPYSTTAYLIYVKGPGQSMSNTDDIQFGVFSFVGYTAATIPVNYFDFSPSSGVGYLAQSTSITLQSSAVTAPVAVTPEPSGMVLLGTGLLSMAAGLRKRFSR